MIAHSSSARDANASPEAGPRGQLGLFGFYSPARLAVDGYVLAHDRLVILRLQAPAWRHFFVRNVSMSSAAAAAPDWWMIIFVAEVNEFEGDGRKWALRLNGASGRRERAAREAGSTSRGSRANFQLKRGPPN